jgi:hypothetical protein
MMHFDGETPDADSVVEYGNYYDEELHRKLFGTQADAASFAESVIRNFRHVWIGVRGEYLTNGGNWRQDWIWIWWTEDTDWGSVPDRGQGTPNSLLSSMDHREYRRLPGR